MCACKKINQVMKSNITLTCENLDQLAELVKVLVELTGNSKDGEEFFKLVYLTNSNEGAVSQFHPRDFRNPERLKKFLAKHNKGLGVPLGARWNSEEPLELRHILSTLIEMSK